MNNTFNLLKRTLVHFIIITIITASTLLFSEVNLTLIHKIKTGSFPKSVEISPDGKTAVIDNLEGCSIWFIDTATYKVTKKINFFKTPAQKLDFKTKKYFATFEEKPVESTFTQNGRYLWVSLLNAKKVVVYDFQETENNPNQFKGTGKKVMIYDLVNKTQKVCYLRAIKVGSTPKIVTRPPNEKYIFVSNWRSASVSVIDPLTFQVIKTIKVNWVPRGHAYTSDSKKLFVANMGASTMSLIDVDKLERITTFKNVGYKPRHLVVGNQDKYLYISNHGDGHIRKLDISTLKVVDKVTVGKQPRSMVKSPDGKYLFVDNYESHDLSILSTEPFREIKRVPTGPKPVGMDISKDGKLLWVTNYVAASVYVYSIEY